MHVWLDRRRRILSSPPHETLYAVQDYSLLRTDHNGWIHLSTDSEQLWVEVERKTRPEKI